MKSPRWIILCASCASYAFALAGVPAASAAEQDMATLRQQVKALNGMVLDLQRRVGRLESGAHPASQASRIEPAVAAPVAPGAGQVSPEAALRLSWAKVEPDMAEDEIMRLLGAPSKKLTLDGRTVWYYDYPATGSGSIFFTDAGRVSSRQSPFGWGW